MMLNSVASSTSSSVPSPSHFPPIHAPTEDLSTDFGNTILWITFGAFIIITFTFGLMTSNIPKHLRFFHYIVLLVSLTTTLMYPIMASGEGWVRHYYAIYIHEGHTDWIVRQLYWIRYFDWVITTSLIIRALTVLAGLSGAEIFFTIIFNVALIFCAWCAAVVYPVSPESKVKLGYYSICGVLFMCIAFILLIPGRRSALARHERVGKFYTAITVYSIIVWILYAVVWGLGDENQMFNVDTEIVLFSILDLLAKGVFGVWLLVACKRIPECNVPLTGWWVSGVGETVTGTEEERTALLQN